MSATVKHNWAFNATVYRAIFYTRNDFLQWYLYSLKYLQLRELPSANRHLHCFCYSELIKLYKPLNIETT